MSAFLIRDQFHIRLFTAGAFDFKAGDWQTQNVKDTYWRFYMNEQDGTGLELAHSNFPFRARHLYFVPADVHFNCYSLAPFKHFYIHFDVLGLSRALKNELFSQPIELAPNSVLRRETRALARTVARAGSCVLPFAVQYRLQSLIISALAHHLETISAKLAEKLEHLSRHQEPISPALDFIEKNIVEELNNSMLARLCGLSEDHFTRRFREISGETPGQYIRNKRITIAAQKLLFTDSSIEEIAIQTGFCNRFYFSRVFASEMGMPPAAYRKEIRP